MGSSGHTSTNSTVSYIESSKFPLSESRDKDDHVVFLMYLIKERRVG